MVVETLIVREEGRVLFADIAAPPEDIKDYDEIVAHILTMADLLSSGIVKQFPEKFASKP